jgi:hypothetical protein
MQLSALAASLALFMQVPSAPQAAPSVQRWAHQLVLLEDVEDFDAGGSSSGFCAELNVEAPVRIGLQRLGRPPRLDGRPAEVEWLRGWYLSPPLTAEGGFEQALLSWNVECPPETGVCVELRVRVASDAHWSPWLYLGDWGSPVPPPMCVDLQEEHLAKSSLDGPSEPLSASQVGGPRSKRVAFDGGAVDVDVFKSEQRWAQAQFRISVDCSENARDQRVRVRRVSVCFSRKTDAPAPPFVLPEAAQRRLATPFRSQRTERPEIAGRICSPTSIAMLLEHRGLQVDTLAAAERIYDAAHDIYGNWTRAIQGAYSFGAPGYLARFSDWNEVAALIAQGTPIAISIAAKEGELDGAPYPKTSGHLLVLCGFDERGDVFVNDPAAGTPELGQLTYRREQLERVWMARGGTSYVLLAPESK